MSTINKFFAMFPGQGSQELGMGKTFYDASDKAMARFAAADEILGFSLTKLCLEGPIEELSKTQFAQPAILTVSTIAYEMFVDRTGFKPTAAAGHSLGEYSALVAAGVITFEEAVLLVHKRGLFMQEAVAPGVGAMVAVLGKEMAEIEAAVSQVTDGVVEFANINAPGQIVIAGTKSAVDQAVSYLGTVKAVTLPVSVPSHTSLMKPAADKLAEAMNAIKFNEPLFPVYSNVTGKPSANVDAIRKNLLSQLTSSVQWVECMRDGLATTGAEAIIEFGQGKVLCGLARRIAPEVKKIAIESPESLEAFCAQK